MQARPLRPMDFFRTDRSPFPHAPFSQTGHYKGNISTNQQETLIRSTEDDVIGGRYKDEDSQGQSRMRNNSNDAGPAIGGCIDALGQNGDALRDEQWVSKSCSGRDYSSLPGLTHQPGGSERERSRLRNQRIRRQRADDRSKTYPGRRPAGRGNYDSAGEKPGRGGLLIRTAFLQTVTP